MDLLCVAQNCSWIRTPGTYFLFKSNQKQNQATYVYQKKLRPISFIQIKGQKEDIVKKRRIKEHAWVPLRDTEN